MLPIEAEQSVEKRIITACNEEYPLGAFKKGNEWWDASDMGLNPPVHEMPGE
jgi:hypothetical protein